MVSVNGKLDCYSPLATLQRASIALTLEMLIANYGRESYSVHTTARWLPPVTKFNHWKDDLNSFVVCSLLKVCGHRGISLTVGG